MSVSRFFRTRALRQVPAFEVSPHAKHFHRIFQDNVPLAKKLITANSRATGAPHFSLRGSKLPAATPNTAADIAEYKMKSFMDMVVAYEAAYAPILAIEAEIAQLSEEINALKYSIAGQTSLSAEEKANVEAQIKEVTAVRAGKHQEILAYASKTFSTEMYNTLLSILRVAIESEAPEIPDAYQLALRLMDDMRKGAIPHDDSTEVLIRAIIFGDGPADNSHLLWKCVEFPELGEIVFTAANEEATQWNVFNAIERRHKLTVKPEFETLTNDVTYSRIVPADYTDIEAETGADDNQRATFVDKLTSPLKSLTDRLRRTGPAKPAPEAAQ